MEILSSEVVNITGNNIWGNIGLVILFLGIVALLYGLIEFYEVWWLIIVGVVLVALGCYSIKTSLYTIDTYTEYKVTIDESANFHAVMDKYEILDQEGEIYTIRKKVNNK